jgi:DNA polymerase-1
MDNSSANQVSNHVLILDGNSVLHRAYHALPDWRNRSGEAMAGVYGFLSMLVKALDEIKPTHLAIVFDHPGPNFRNLIYVGYQTNREKDRQLAEDIWGQIEKLKVVFEKVGVPTFQVEGFEADDVIGTLSRQLSVISDQLSVTIITGDRDLMQLVSDQVNLYMPIKGMSDMQTINREKVKERLGVYPEQVIDYKALVGDSSDNYPGIQGIGPVGAVKLISEFGTFEDIVKKSGNKKVIDGYESGELSKRLATIKCDVPVTFDSAKCQVPSAKQIVEVLQELGYKSLIRRMTGKTVKIDDDQPKLFDL